MLYKNNDADVCACVAYYKIDLRTTEIFFRDLIKTKNVIIAEISLYSLVYIYLIRS